MSESSERIDVVLHPDAVRDLGTVTDLVQSALAARGATGEVHVSDDPSVASGDVIVVPAPGGHVDALSDDRCVVRVDYGYVAADLSAGLHAHIRGRGLGGLRYAVDRIVHHRLHPATVESYGAHPEQFAEVRGTSGPVVALTLTPWFALMTLVTAAALARRMGRRRPAPGEAGTPRFLVVVPAHDEEGVIAVTVRSCLALDYDPGRFQVVVIADNCTDATAEIAVPDALESLTAGGDRLHKAIGAMIRAEPIAP